MTDMVELWMTNSINDLKRLIEEANSFLESHRLPKRTLYNANLVLEEVLTNIVKYAYHDDCSHQIGVVISLTEDELTIEFEDDGNEFNPLTVQERKPAESLWDTEAGGLGLHLVKKTVDCLEYLRHEGRNRLRTRMTVSSSRV
jgi:serine/threonine-protein kinase RsbW